MDLPRNKAGFAKTTKFDLKTPISAIEENTLSLLQMEHVLLMELIKSRIHSKEFFHSLKRHAQVVQKFSGGHRVIPQQKPANIAMGLD